MSSIVAIPPIIAQMKVPAWAVFMSIVPGTYQSTEDSAPRKAPQITRNFVTDRA